MLCNSACALHVYMSLSIYKLNAFDSAEASNKNSEEVHMVIPKTELSCAYARMPWIGKSLYMVPSQSSYYEIVERFFFMGSIYVGFHPLNLCKDIPETPPSKSQ